MVDGILVLPGTCGITTERNRGPNTCCLGNAMISHHLPSILRNAAQVSYLALPPIKDLHLVDRSAAGRIDYS